MDLQSSEIDLNNDFCALDIISKIAFASQELQSTVFLQCIFAVCSDFCSAKVIDIYIDIWICQFYTYILSLSIYTSAAYNYQL